MKKNKHTWQSLEIFGENQDREFFTSYINNIVIGIENREKSTILFFDNSRIIEIWFTFGSYMVTGLLIPFICILLNIKIKYPVILILFPILLTLVWDIMQINWMFSIYPGLFLSCILGFFLRSIIFIR